MSGRGEALVRYLRSLLSKSPSGFITGRKLAGSASSTAEGVGHCAKNPEIAVCLVFHDETLLISTHATCAPQRRLSFA